MDFFLLQQRDKHLANMRQVPIVRLALDTLKEYCPKSLTYHTPEHTDDVMAEVVLFALMDRLSERQIELLTIAAAFHDLGFIDVAKENEFLGAERARSAMLAEGKYTQKECDIVQTMILDTRILLRPGGPRQIPSTDLSRYLLDGDVSNLGRDDFFEKAELVWKESNLPLGQFYAQVLGFLNGHRWYTSPAKELRQEKKDANVQLLAQKLSQGQF